MAKAFDVVGGISVQNFCNLNFTEFDALFRWINTLRFTPYDYEFLTTWHSYWSSLPDGYVSRREVFESVYGFAFGQRFNPLTQKFEDVIVIGNSEYFNWLLDFTTGGSYDCTDYLFPEWP